MKLETVRRQKAEASAARVADQPRPLGLNYAFLIEYHVFSAADWEQRSKKDENL
jgi:hypothetical protein